MNGTYSTPDDSEANELPTKASEQPRNAVISTISRASSGRPRHPIIPLGMPVRIILGFWLAQFLLTTALTTIEHDPVIERSFYAPRAITSLFGVLISIVIVSVQKRFSHLSISARAAVALAMVFIGTVAHTFLNRLTFQVVVPELFAGAASGWVAIAQDLLYRFWIFGSLSAIILALSYAADIREREERISALQVLAHSAQLRALRSQLHPHFLFNALNSIVALLSARRAEEAEAMAENLADFLRATLALDSERLITLGEEIRLQQLYLSIEKVRFPDRLEVTTRIPSALSEVLVPSLITQPLIENSIKHAVARSTDTVELRIEARSKDGFLELVVEDDGGNADHRPTKGANLGLANVAERLRGHYGRSAQFEAELKPPRGFRNVIVVPMWPRP